MAILMDLPNELLLSIIANVSPLSIDSFVFSCKRLYDLRADTMRAHSLVRSRFPSELISAKPTELLRSIFRDPDIASYPLMGEFCSHQHWEIDGMGAPEDLFTEINAQARESRLVAFSQVEYPGFPELETPRMNALYLILPLLFTRLLNLRKLRFCGYGTPNLLETVSQVVEASHDPVLSLKNPLPLGRLTVARIDSLSLYGMNFAILLAMIPTLRKLNVELMGSTEPYTCTRQHHPSGVTELLLASYVDMSYIEELVGRTDALQRFTYNHDNCKFPATFQPVRLVELLKQRASQSLNHLRLITHDTYPGYPEPWRNHNDLSLGSLRGFTSLKTLVTCVDMFIKRRGHSESETGTGTTQRLASWLPASLEALVLYKGSATWNEPVWNGTVLRMLFRGVLTKKQTRVPNLKLIHFEHFPDFDTVIPGELTVACRATGVKIAYTPRLCANPDCPRVIRRLETWDDLPWVTALGNCCRYRKGLISDWAPV